MVPSTFKALKSAAVRKAFSPMPEKFSPGPTKPDFDRPDRVRPSAAVHSGFARICNILADTFATPSSVGGMVGGLPSTSMDGRLIGFVYVRLMSTSVSGTFPAGLPHGVDSLAPDAAPSAPEVGAGAPAAPPAATRLAAARAPAPTRAAEGCAIPH